MMPNQKGKQWVNIAVALTGTILVTVLLAFFFDSYYDINDDVLMKDILSGYIWENLLLITFKCYIPSVRL